MAPSTDHLYRPSNGSEGMAFQEIWCERCRRDLKGNCPILGATMMLDIGEPGYPREWTFSDAGSPICTAFKARDTPRRGFRCRKTGDLFSAKQREAVE